MGDVDTLGEQLLVGAHASHFPVIEHDDLIALVEQVNLVRDEDAGLALEGSADALVEDVLPDVRLCSLSATTEEKCKD